MAAQRYRSPNADEKKRPCHRCPLHPRARFTRWAINADLARVLPFNIYGWTVGTNTPSYVNAPWYLWLRIPMQAVFIAFAWFGTRDPKAPRPDVARAPAGA